MKKFTLYYSLALFLAFSQQVVGMQYDDKDLVKKNIEIHINNYYNKMAHCDNLYKEAQARCRDNNIHFHGVAYPFIPQTDLKNELKQTLNLGEAFDGRLKVRLLDLDYFGVNDYNDQDLFRVYIYTQLKGQGLMDGKNEKEITQEMVLLFADMFNDQKLPN